jgi:RNA polymerase sigma factor (sigma-70 family)
MSDEEILGIRNIGVKAVAEIREKLEGFSPESWLTATKPTAQRPEIGSASSPVPLEKEKEPVSAGTMSSSISRDSAKETPLKVLGLSVRPLNTLMHRGIDTVERLEGMSDEEILEVRNLGRKSLTEIREKLAAFLRGSSGDEPLLDKQAQEVGVNSTPLPLLPVEAIQAFCRRGVPLNEISIDRLALSGALENKLSYRRIQTLDDLAQQPRNTLPDEATLVDRFRFYLNWFLKQDTAVRAIEISGKGVSPLYSLMLKGRSLDALVENWLSVLRRRQQQIIRLRYGLQSEELTLQEIGDRLNITRERVRQLQKQALRRLRSPEARDSIRALRRSLVYWVEKAGGLVSEAELEEMIGQEMAIGDTNPAGVTRLLADLDDGLFGIREVNIGAFTSRSRGQVQALNEQLANVLSKPYVLLPVDMVLSRFKESHFYQDHYDQYQEAFITTCLKTHPQIVIDDDNMCGLKGWANKKVTKIVLALRQIGRPTHYSTVAERVNCLLPPRQRSLAKTIRAHMDRRASIFVHLGRGQYWFQSEIESERLPQDTAGFGDLFGARLARWQAELDQRQHDESFDTQAEVDAIRHVGLDFFDV